MANQYYNCYHCKRITYRHDKALFEIQGYSSYDVCSHCQEEVVNMLDLAAPLPYPLFIENKATKQRIVFECLDELQTWFEDKNEEDYNFGMYRDVCWDEVEKASFIGEGSCGGMSRQEIVEAAIGLTKGGSIMINAVWRGRETRPGSNILMSYCTSHQDLLRKLEIHEGKNNLEGIPVIVSGYYCAQEFADFSCPDENPKLKWTETLGDLVKMLLDPKEAASSSHPVWSAKQEFLDYQLKNLDRKAEKLQKKRSVFEELEESLKKRIKV